MGIPQHAQNLTNKIRHLHCKQGDYRFLPGGAKYFKLCAKHAIFLPSLCGGKVITEGGKHLFPSFILIWLFVLFWHCIFSKLTVSLNKHIQELSDDFYLQAPPSLAVRYICMVVKVSCQLAKTRWNSLLSSLNSHVYWDSLNL